MNVGDTQTLLIPGGDDVSLNTTILASPNIVEGPDVRSRFTGTRLPANALFILFLKMLEKFWAYEDNHSIISFATEAPIVQIRHTEDRGGD